MARLLIEIPDGLVGKLALFADSHSIIVDTVIARAIEKYIDMPEPSHVAIENEQIESALSVAIQQLKKLKSGTRFELPQLFDPTMWKALPVGTRNSIGRRFRKAVQDGTVPAKFIERNVQRHAIYEAVLPTSNRQ